MPNQKPTKTKQGTAKPQTQQSHSPAGSKVVRADPLALDSLQPPNPEKGNKPQPTQDAGAGQSDQKISKPYSRIETTNIALSLIFSFAIVVFTAFSTYYSSKQWEGLQQSLTDARETRELENRSYLFVKGANVGGELKEGGRVAALLTFANAGQSPAQNVSVWVNVDFKNSPVPEPMPMFPDDATQEPSYGVVGPQGEMNITSYYKGVLTADKVGLINQRAETLYAWGIIEYDDIFQKRRKTEFCLRHVPGTDKMQPCSNNNRLH
ncbi:MAG: hypothetical protein ACJ754_07915 [Pyrinomonadaceae bacterium]